ncbi:MAG: hypothetical protein V8R64_06505 [Thomasclavelia sp.]
MAAVYAYDETNNDETMVPVSNVRTIDNTGNDEISNDEDDVVDNEIGDVTNVNFELQLRLDF